MNKTNLQRFAELYINEEGIDKLILENFNNQDSDTYTLNGIEYLLFTKEDVQDKLDEDFNNEIYDFCYKFEDKYPKITIIIEKYIDERYNYKSIANDYDNLNDYYFECSDDEIYVYTKK